MGSVFLKLAPPQSQHRTSIYFATQTIFFTNRQQYALQWQPPTDLYETPNSAIVRIEIAGMTPENFKLQLTGRSLHVSGTRTDPLNLARAYHKAEIFFGDFATQVELPFDVDIDRVEATYENGFLTIFLPRSTA